MAGDLLTKDLVTYDPLSATTRKERTALLGLSMLGIALVRVPLVPEKVAFLGIEFAKIQQEKFVFLYGLIVLYYLVAFLVYAFTDYVAWRRQEVINLHEYDVQRSERSRSADASSGKESLHANPGSKRFPVGSPGYTGFASYWLAFAAARARAAFEFLLPTLFSAYALYALFSFKAVAGNA